MTFYPWHKSFRERITRQFNSKKLAHAILFAGPEYLGKFDFAMALSNQFLCSAISESEACGACASCLLVKAGTHPDLRFLQPEDSKQIKIAQIRHLIGWVSQTSQRAGLKIAIVCPAEQMNHQSANALLKCLEEPAPNTLIFLVTARPGSLLPTIRSRCQQYTFSAPDRDVSLDWLRTCGADIADPSLLLHISGGAPLAVVNRFDEGFLERREQVVGAINAVLGDGANPTAAAAVIQNHEADEVLETILGVLADCLKYKLSNDENSLKNRDLMSQIVNISTNCASDFLFSAFDRVSDDLKVVRSTSNPNKALLLEGLMIDLSSRQSRPLVEYSL